MVDLKVLEKHQISLNEAVGVLAGVAIGHFAGGIFQKFTGLPRFIVELIIAGALIAFKYGYFGLGVLAHVEADLLNGVIDVNAASGGVAGVQLI